jgi:hypothetical protein
MAAAGEEKIKLKVSKRSLFVKPARKPKCEVKTIKKTKTDYVKEYDEGQFCVFFMDIFLNSVVGKEWLDAFCVECGRMKNAIVAFFGIHLPQLQFR